jgi:hypothetical protein
MSNQEIDGISNFFIRIAEDPMFRTQYEENPTKIMDEAEIPKEKQVVILSGDIENIQSVLGMACVAYMLVHSDL